MGKNKKKKKKDKWMDDLVENLMEDEEIKDTLSKSGITDDELMEAINKGIEEGLEEAQGEKKEDKMEQIIVYYHPDWSEEMAIKIIRDTLKNTLINAKKNKMTKWLGKEVIIKNLEPVGFQITCGPEFKGTVKLGKDPIEGKNSITIKIENTTQRASWFWEGIDEALKEEEAFSKSLDELVEQYK